MRRHPVLAALALGLALSCASYDIRTDSAQKAPPKAPALQGKRIAVRPVQVNLGAGRLVIDLRDAKLKVNGEEIVLQSRYLANDESFGLGKYGVLDVNILKKAKVDEAALSRQATELLAAGLRGEHDYQVGFMKGLGEGNMGSLSNRPYALDPSVYPPVGSFAPHQGSPSLYSSVTIVGPQDDLSGYDLVLDAEIGLSNEVVEVFSNDSTMPAEGAFGPPARPGEYFINLMGSILFRISDARTGKVVLSEKDPSDWAAIAVLRRSVRVPANKGDAAAFAKYFRTVDLNPYAREAIELIANSALPYLNSFYVNTTHRIPKK